MNKYIYILISFLCFSVVLSSCLKDDKDFFDESAAVRIDKEVQKYHELLTKPAEGWIMEYYPGGINRTYGGFAITVKFISNDRVVVQSVLSDDVSKTETSYYSIKKDAGATLNFDTYNSLFHFFSDSDIAEGDGRGKGYMGDYEFILMSASDDMIVMKGKKHSSVIKMYALKESATSYLTKAKASYTEYSSNIGFDGTLTGTLGGKPVVGDFTYYQQFFLTQDGNRQRVEFMFTDQGLKLYEHKTFGSYVLQDLAYNQVNQTFSSNDGLTVLNIAMDPEFLNLLGDYKFESTYFNAPITTISVLSSSTIPKVGNKVTLSGLPFDIIMTFNKGQRCFEINPQVVLANPQVTLCPWNPTSGNLTWGVGEGVFVKRINQTNTFEFINNGGGNNSNALITWQIGTGEYSGFGVSRYLNVILTKL